MLIPPEESPGRPGSRWSRQSDPGHSPAAAEVARVERTREDEVARSITYSPKITSPITHRCHGARMRGRAQWPCSWCSFLLQVRRTVRVSPN